jgi:23S rRNA (adenine2503-C2)-methyltransferase
VSEPESIYDLSLETLRSRLTDWGEPSYRAHQVWSALYQGLVDGPAQITTLPAALRHRLAQAFRSTSFTSQEVTRSRGGGTEKLLLRLPDGPAIEAVLMRYQRRRTACVSTQAGCAMGCSFCATGQMGLKRHLTSGEIVEQVLLMARGLRQRQDHLTNIVVMGMGEPFHNFQATMQAIDRLHHPQGFGFGARRITISTVGLVPGIERFTRERRQVNLSVSLHAATNPLRDQIVPINRRYPLEDLIAACRAYVETTGRRISFEWALIRGLNDGPEQAEALVRLVSNLTCHVNLIPLNPTPGFAGKGSSRRQAEAFSKVLARHRIPCTVRVRRGFRIRAGCGQLATRTDHARISGPKSFRG